MIVVTRVAHAWQHRFALRCASVQAPSARSKKTRSGLTISRTIALHVARGFGPSYMGGVCLVPE